MCAPLKSMTRSTMHSKGNSAASGLQSSQEATCAIAACATSRQTMKRTVSRPAGTGLQTDSFAGQFEQCCKGIATKMQHLRFLNAHALIDLRKYPVQPLTNGRSIF